MSCIQAMRGRTYADAPSSSPGNLDIVKLLLASGADISLKVCSSVRLNCAGTHAVHEQDDDGQTALELAREADHDEIAQLLEDATQKP